MFPTADQIALAVVTAAKLTGDNPVAAIRGVPGNRARLVAMEALMAAFPDARRVGLGRCLGFGTPGSAHGNVINARKLKWWREGWVDEVVGALVADQYGDQAA